MLGRSVEEVLGRDDTELFSPDTARQIIQADREIIAEGAIRTFENLATSSNVTNTYLTTKGPYRDYRGHDRSDRHLAGHHRAQAHGRGPAEPRNSWRDCLDHAPAPIYVTTCDGRRRLVNRAWEKSCGGCRARWPSAAGDEISFLRSCISLSGRESTDHRDGDASSGGGSGICAEGRHYLYTVKFPLRDAANQIEAVGGISLDITERKRTEEAIEASHRRLQALFDNALDAIWLLDDEGRFVEANPAVCSLLGYTREEFLRMSIEDVTSVQDRGLVRDLWHTILATGRLSGEITQVCKDGSTREVDYRVVTHILPGLHLSVNRDITERKRALDQLRRQKEILQTIFDHIPIMINLIDGDGRIRAVNR